MLDAIQLAQDALRRAQAEHAGQSSAAASMEQIAAGVSAIVNAVKAAAEQGAAEKAAMADMVRQIGTGLADVVGLLEAHAERPDDHAARAQALALDGMFAQQHAERDIAEIHTIITALFALEEVF